MYISVDESGTVSVPETQTISAVGAIIIPNRRLPTF
jgi:hypothetical protein